MKTVYHTGDKTKRRQGKYTGRKIADRYDFWYNQKREAR